jgi:hypothetical protein
MKTLKTGSIISLSIILTSTALIVGGCHPLTPVFQDTGDHEEAPEIPCANHEGTGYVTGWHRCHQKDPQNNPASENGLYNCCGDGYSCGEDDFVPSKTHICRWRGIGELPR